MGKHPSNGERIQWSKHLMEEHPLEEYPMGELTNWQVKRMHEYDVEGLKPFT